MRPLRMLSGRVLVFPRSIARQCMFTCTRWSMAAETGPTPGIDRKNLAFAAEVSSCATTLSIHRSRSPTCVSSMVRRSASMPSTSAEMSCFLRPARSQRSEDTQILGRQPSTGFRSEQHEPGDQLCIDPVYLRAGAPGKDAGLDLCRGQLACASLTVQTNHPRRSACKIRLSKNYTTRSRLRQAQTASFTRLTCVASSGKLPMTRVSSM